MNDWSDVYNVPCSGLTGPVPYFGPPIAPRRMACALLAASRASSVSGEPVASIEQPPRRCSWKLNSRSGIFFSRTFITCSGTQLVAYPIPLPVTSNRDV